MAGALSRAVGNAARQVAVDAPSRVQPPKAANNGTRLGGALSRVVDRTKKNPRVPTRPVMNNHMVTDQSIGETGEGLRNLVGRIATRGRVAAKRGGPIRRAEGGKVGTAMSALRALAKKYQEAIESGDTVLARRLKRQLDAAGVEDTETKVGNEKAQTFAEGGKVKAVTKAVQSQRARLKKIKDAIAAGFRKSAKMKDDEPVKVRFGKNEDTHVSARGKKYSHQAGSDDDRYSFRSDDGENVPVDFTDDMFDD